MNKYGFDIISVSIHGIIDCCYTVGLKKYGISDFVVFEKDLIMTSESSTDVNYDDLLKYITLIKRFSEKEIIQ